MFDYQEHELMHWGLKGMKWGIRRFRNPDGTLTEAGKARYEKKQAAKDLKQRKWERNPRNSIKLSDEQLNKTLDRLRKENQIKDLQKSGLQKWVDNKANASAKNTKSFASKFVDSIGGAISSGVAENIKKAITSTDMDDVERERKERAAEVKDLTNQVNILKRRNELAELRNPSNQTVNSGREIVRNIITSHDEYAQAVERSSYTSLGRESIDWSEFDGE